MRTYVQIRSYISILVYKNLQPVGDLVGISVGLVVDVSISFSVLRLVGAKFISCRILFVFIKPLTSLKIFINTQLNA